MDKAFSNMTASRLCKLFVPPLLAFSLAACGSVRLQSFDQMTKQVADASYHGDRRDCNGHADSAAYRECVRRTDAAYAAWRDRDKPNKPDNQR